MCCFNWIHWYIWPVWVAMFYPGAASKSCGKKSFCFLWIWENYMLSFLALVFLCSRFLGSDNDSPNYIFSVTRLEPGLLVFPLPWFGIARIWSKRLLSIRNGKSTRLCPSSSLPSCNGMILKVRFGLFGLSSYIFYILYSLYFPKVFLMICS